MAKAPLEFRRLGPEWAGPLVEFFLALARSGEDRHFHPHPFTAAEAEVRARYVGEDLYYLAVDGGQIVAYGMLRGWDEGYTVPSLGVAVHPACRGRGLGRAMMHFLHAAARRRGATRVRLKVYPDNSRARRLYEELGYRFEGGEAGQLVGLLDLA